MVPKKQRTAFDAGREIVAAKMEPLLFTVTTPEEDAEVIYHIPGRDGYITACGLCDVPYEEHWADEHRPDCPACIDVVRHYKNLKTGRLKGKIRWIKES